MAQNRATWPVQPESTGITGKKMGLQGTPRCSDIVTLHVLSMQNTQMPGGESFTTWQWGGRGVSRGS